MYSCVTYCDRYPVLCQFCTRWVVFLYYYVLLLYGSLNNFKRAERREGVGIWEDKEVINEERQIKIETKTKTKRERERKNEKTTK